MEPFYYISPLMQYILIEKNIKEYHIRLRNNKYYQHLYFQNFKKDIWIDIKRFINEKYKDIISQSGTDYTYDNKTFIWIQIQKDKNIDEIIKSLNEDWFSEKLINVNMIPKLLTIVNKTLETDTKFMAQSICEYQAKYGKDKTIFTLDIFFSDIKRQCARYTNHIYNSSDSDMDF